jgi:hypothetical protein
VAALAASLLLPAALAAQGHEGFLLHQPRVTLGFHMGYSVPGASSEVFDFVQDRLTVDRRDFNAPAFGGSLGVWVNPRLDVQLDVTYARSHTPSEFRDWVDQDNLPIEQETSFSRVPATVGLKWYVKDRGRSIGRFAWIPTNWNAYLGAAGGLTWYTFSQNGDFVDYETLDIFFDRLSTSGSTPTAQLFGGADYSLSPHFLLNVEGRYSWAQRADMAGDYLQFDRMDLSGFQATVGLSARF